MVAPTATFLINFENRKVLRLRNDQKYAPGESTIWEELVQEWLTRWSVFSDAPGDLCTCTKLQVSNICLWCDECTNYRYLYLIKIIVHCRFGCFELMLFGNGLLIYCALYAIFWLKEHILTPIVKILDNVCLRCGFSLCIKKNAVFKKKKWYLILCICCKIRSFLYA